MTDDDDALAGGSAGPVMSLATHTKRVDVDHAPLSSIGATCHRIRCSQERAVRRVTLNEPADPSCSLTVATSAR